MTSQWEMQENAFKAIEQTSTSISAQGWKVGKLRRKVEYWKKEKAKFQREPHNLLKERRNTEKKEETKSRQPPSGDEGLRL